MTQQAKPFIKWVGGKSQLLPDLFKLFPRQIKHYYEPFMGGAAAFFALSSSPEHSFEHAVLNDLNDELVTTYQIVRDRPTELQETLTAWRTEYMKDHHRWQLKDRCAEGPEAYYYQLRDRKPEDALERAARMIFLNKTCFNGLYRVNQSGGFNSPWGKRLNPTLFEPEVIAACSKALQETPISSGDYIWPLAGATEGDLVYFDPPYAPVNATSDFTSYTSDGFDNVSQQRLAQEFARLARAGVTVFLSNSDTPFIRELYRDFEIVTVQARRNVNSKGGARGPVNEVIVTHRSAAA